MNSLFGIKIVEHPFAERLVFKVEGNARKRRKRYRVVKRMEPCAIMMNPSALGLFGFNGIPVLAIHPKLAVTLKGLS